jgi:apolipoprotein N-acyltransferase
VCHRRWGLPNALVIPLVWVGLEYLRMHLFSGFGWLMLAHSVYSWTRVIQIADIAGVYGVSFLLALGNGVIVELVTLPMRVKGPAGPVFHPGLSWRVPIAGLLLFLNVGYGQYRTENAPLRPGPRVAIVQTNVAQNIRNDVDRSDEYFRSVWETGRQAEKVSADLVVFPETSYPYWYGQIEEGLSNLESAREYQEQVTAPGRPLREKPTEEMGQIIRDNLKDGDEHTQAMARMLSKPILMGSAFWSIRLAGAKLTNASVMITPERGRTARYDKVHLVPFGEYIPLGGNIPLIKYLVPYPEDFNYNSDHGADLVSLHEGKLHLAPLICFEDTIPDLTRRYLRQATADRPVEILVNQSNDGWFNNSIEAWYHLAAAVFRTVESRRPMVRSSNTGLSNLVNSLGEVSATFTRDGKKQGIDGLLVVDVPLDDRLAPYVWLGDWLAMVAWGVIGVCLTLSLGRQVGRVRQH